MEIQEHNIKPQNIQFHCRTCLNELTDQKHKVTEMPVKLLDVFKTCTGYKKRRKEDLLPDCICEKCYEKLEVVDEFQAMSKKSMQVLEEILKSYKVLPKIVMSTSTEDIYQSEENVDYITKSQTLPNDDPLNEREKTDIIVKQEIEVEPEITNDSFSDKEESLSMDLKPEEITLNRTNDKRSKNTCKVCHKSYSSASALSTHKRIHLETRPFQCGQCERGFNKRFRLNEHIKKFHEDNIKEPETKMLKDNHLLNANIKTDLDFKASYDANSEQASKIRPQHNANLFLCTICVRNYSSSTALRIHMLTHEKTRPFKCDKCDKGFNARSRLKRHVDEIHSDNPIEIPCKYGCGKVFQRYSSAQAHYKLKHILPAAGMQPKDYSCMCEECGKICKNRYFLTEHSFQHVPLEETPYKCEPCNRHFRSKKHMKRHLVRHEPIKKFQCPHCSLRTATREELRKHINRHTKEIQYPCPICNKVFTGAENMRRHKRIVHEGVKNYKCRFCEESFGKAETRKHHEMRHTGERPHKCEVCGKSFIQLVALKAHMKTHNKSPKFPEAVKLESANITEPRALLDISGINKLPIFSDSQKLFDISESNHLQELAAPNDASLM